MKYLSSRIFYSITLYILVMTLIFIKKPTIIFTANGDIRTFGLSKEPDKYGVNVNSSENTIYSLGIITAIIAIVSFYLFCVIDMIFDD